MITTKKVIRYFKVLDVFYLLQFIWRNLIILTISVIILNYLYNMHYKDLLKYV